MFKLKLLPAILVLAATLQTANSRPLAPQGPKAESIIPPAEPCCTTGSGPASVPRGARGLRSEQTAFAADAAVMFEEIVRPILEAKCYECHSAKADEVKGNLRLDSVAGILKGGDNGPAVRPGDVENSFLLRAIRYQEDDYQMPPSGRLDDEKIKAIEAWVKSLDYMAEP